MAKQTTEEFLAGLDPVIREIAAKLLKLIQDELPNAIEMVDETAHLIGYGFDTGYRGLVCAIAPQRGYVNLMFSRGADLQDPEHLLEGTGKKARHVKVRSTDDAVTPAIRLLVRANASLISESLRGRH